MEQFREAVRLLTESKLVENFGTCKTEDKGIEEEQIIEPLITRNRRKRIISHSYVIPTRTRVVRVEREEEPVMWSIAPKSIIQGEEEEKLRAILELPELAKLEEEEGGSEIVVEEMSALDIKRRRVCNSSWESGPGSHKVLGEVSDK